jgi:hypothetical protein
MRAVKFREPFQPFWLVLHDGQRIEVPSRYSIAWGQDATRTVVVISSTGRHELIDLEAIASLDIRWPRLADSKDRKRIARLSFPLSTDVTELLPDYGEEWCDEAE